MKPEEFVEYILKHMTAEEALLKLIKLQTDQYDKIKLGQPINPKPGDTINPLMIIVTAAMDLGWDLAIESGEKSKEVRGIMIGTKEYLKDNLPKTDGGEKV